MRYHILYFFQNLQCIFLLLLVLSSCEIEDEHGTLQFVAGLEGWTSQHGEMLSQHYGSLASLEFLVSEEKKQIFFLGCRMGEGWCETHALVSINYETGEAKELFDLDDHSWIHLIPNQPLKNRLLFLEPAENEGVSRLHAIDLDTYSDHIIRSLVIHETRIVANEQFVIHNNGYETSDIFKTDYSGNTSKLLPTGEVVLAIPNSSKVLIDRYNLWRYALYDYHLKSFDYTKNSQEHYSSFYANEHAIYYVTDYGPYAIRDLMNDEVVIELEPADIFLDFNPNCFKVLVMRTAEIESSNPYIDNLLTESQLLVSDLDGNVITSEIRLIDEYILHARILDDGKTIIYDSDGKLYITSIE